MLWFALLLLVVYTVQCDENGLDPPSFLSQEVDDDFENTSLSVPPKANLYLTPSDYFLSGGPKPRLEIIRPKNGEVLDTRDLTIIINIRGFDTEASFHGSLLCVALSTGSQYSEQCFDHTDFTFHANGLLPGTNYGLRIVLFDRGQAVAVSVRNFRVGGVLGIPQHEGEILTIKTAVQLAVQYQAQGMESQAAAIYRSVLEENPTYPDALHLLGVVYYQKGDAVTAVQYVEKALQTSGNFSFDGFHNTLGVCYRTLGRIDEAEEQFRIALSLSPDLLSAQYNLGLIYQQKNRLDEAMEVYRNVTNYFKVFPNAIGIDKAIECKVRECDILQTLQRYNEALPCWKEGIALFPNTAIFHHELGDLQAKLGQMELALGSFRVASNLGRFLSYLNVAYILEQLGFYADSQATYQAVLQHVQLQQLPSYHIKVRLATLMPRVFASPKDILAVRERHLHAFQRLLTTNNNNNTASEDEIEIDNTSPLSGGFAIGYHYLFHHFLPNHMVSTLSALLGGGSSSTEKSKADMGMGLPVLISNKELKIMLYKLYSAMCPSLSHGYFIGVDTIMNDEMESDRYLEAPNHQLEVSDKKESSSLPPLTIISSMETESAEQGMNQPEPSKTTSSTTNNDDEEKNNDECAASSKTHNKKIRIGFVSRYLFHHQVGILSNGLIELLSGKTTYPGLDDIADYRKLEVHVFFIEGGSGSTNVDDDSNAATTGKGNGIGTSIYHDHLQARIIRNSQHNHFLTNYYYHNTSNSNNTYDEGDGENSSAKRRSRNLGGIAGLSGQKDLTNFAQEIRNANLDILIYPEIGLDPVTYFLAFTRLAKIQMVWLGHPDTTGINTIDYFITSDVELLPTLEIGTVSGSSTVNVGSKRASSSIVKPTVIKGDEEVDPTWAWMLPSSRPSPSSSSKDLPNFQSLSEQHRLTYYSERNVIAMPNFGTLFLDLYRNRAHLQFTSPRTVLLNRLKFIESIRIPKNAHLYVIPHSTIKLPPDFDVILLSLLQQDKLAYLLITDLGQAHESWQLQFMERLIERMFHEYPGTVLSEEMKERILFPSPVSPTDMSGILQIAHVVLDPFPVTGSFDTSLEALAMGIPVVTWPVSPLTAGRMALALYRMMEYGITKKYVPIIDDDEEDEKPADPQAESSKENQHSGADEGTNVEGKGEKKSKSNLKQEEEYNSLYFPLVVHSMDEYVKTALKLTHHPKAREFHSMELLKRRDRLFQGNGTRIVELWTNLFKQALSTVEGTKCKH